MSTPYNKRVLCGTYRYGPAMEYPEEGRRSDAHDITKGKRGTGGRLTRSRSTGTFQRGFATARGRWQSRTKHDGSQSSEARADDPGPHGGCWDEKTGTHADTLA